MDRKVYYALGATALGLLLMLSSGYIGWTLHTSATPNEPVREEGYEFIRPLLLCNLDSSRPENEDKELSLDLEKYILSHKDSSIGVYYINQSTRKWAGSNENMSFSPASMLKVPIMAAILRTSEDVPSLLSKKILYDGSFNDNALESTQPSHPLEPGRSYSVEELLTYMIAYSDNNATHLLHDLLTPEQFEDIYIDLGIEAPTINGPVDFMSAKTFTLFLRLLFNGTYLSHTHSEKALSIMSKSDYEAGITAGVPASITVADKFGERLTGDPKNNELHDCGIVYKKNANPYTVCIMTSGKNLDELKKVVEDISLVTYRSF
jgi:beta-lactamase class A